MSLGNVAEFEELSEQEFIDPAKYPPRFSPCLFWVSI